MERISEKRTKKENPQSTRFNDRREPLLEKGAANVSKNVCCTPGLNNKGEGQREGEGREGHPRKNAFATLIRFRLGGTEHQEGWPLSRARKHGARKKGYHLVEKKGELKTIGGWKEGERRKK